MSKNVTANYQQAQVGTANPGQRVVLVYRGIVKNLQSAIELIGAAKDDPNNLLKAGSSIQLAEQLVLELQLALDKEKGGALAKDLDGLYDFWRRHLSDANVKKSREMIQEVLNMVKDLAESWAAAEKSARATMNKTGDA
ncbi:MAG: flagellar export chaperone FliS [Lentisphaerae bacterium GWF2_52_8]|nr:MAG: flagellar export chaperone FliS [Lentisphaerae bacterium GWF2_52_8]